MPCPAGSPGSAAHPQQMQLHEVPGTPHQHRRHLGATTNPGRRLARLEPLVTGSPCSTAQPSESNSTRNGLGASSLLQRLLTSTPHTVIDLAQAVAAKGIHHCIIRGPCIGSPPGGAGPPLVSPAAASAAATTPTRRPSRALSEDVRLPTARTSHCCRESWDDSHHPTPTQTYESPTPAASHHHACTVGNVNH